MPYSRSMWQVKSEKRISTNLMAMRDDMKPDMLAATVAKIIPNYLINAELFKKMEKHITFLTLWKILGP